MIGIVAKFKIKDGKQQAFEALFLELAAKVRAQESGNKLYQLCRSRKAADVYTIMELYDSEQALKHHRETEHSRAAGPKLAEIFAAAPEIELLDTV